MGEGYAAGWERGDNGYTDRWEREVNTPRWENAAGLLGGREGEVDC